MRRALEGKGVSLADTLLEGSDLDALIRLLYRNLDIMASSIAELPGTSILKLRIDTGDSPPVRKRAYTALQTQPGRQGRDKPPDQGNVRGWNNRRE
jgi:hypothetical protein